MILGDNKLFNHLLCAVYYRIMVLDQGEVKEFDNPQVLLQRTNSLFYQLAKDAGIV